MGAEHSLAIYRATVAVLLSAWFVCLVALGTREQVRGHEIDAYAARTLPGGRP